MIKTKEAENRTEAESEDTFYGEVDEKPCQRGEFRVGDAYDFSE